MKRLRLFLLILLWLLAALVGLVLLLRFWPGDPPLIAEPFEIIAHRGVHQNFPPDNLSDTTCTAQIIEPPSHDLLENTLPSIQAAFDAGATLVEIDIHHTKDNHIVVFHDWTVDCRTEGKGVTQEQTLSYLKTLDVGYGYTADGGKTFPFRGKGVGMMPTLEEVLDAFPKKRFILHQKSSEERTIEVLASVLQRYPHEQQARLSYWGVRYDSLKAKVPHIGARFFERSHIKACGLSYLFSGGLGELPQKCRGGIMLLPDWAVKYLWGWPNRFMSKVVEADEHFIVTEVDSIEDAAFFSDLPIHGIMTDRIELVGPSLRDRFSGP